MVYSTKQIQNNPENFPPPQIWMTWVEEVKAIRSDPIEIEDEDGSKRTVHDYEFELLGEGKIRHYYTLAHAKKALGWLSRKTGKYEHKYYSPAFIKRTSGKFRTNWAIYEWVEGEWVLRYSGRVGEGRETSPLYRLKIDKDGQVHPLDKIREQEAREAYERSLRRAL